MKKMLLRMLKKLNEDPTANKEEIAELTAELAELESLEAESKKKEKDGATELEKQIEKLKADARKAEEDKMALLDKLKGNGDDKSDPIADAIKAEKARLEDLKAKQKELELQATLDGLKADQDNMLAKLADAEKKNKLLQNKNEITALKIEKPHLAELLDKITLEGDTVTSESIASELAFVFKFNDEEKLKADYEAKSKGTSPFATETDLKNDKLKNEKKGDKTIPKEVEGDKLDENIDEVARRIAEDPNFINTMYMDC